VDFVEFLRRKKIVAGVKLDLGLVPLLGTQDEKTTQGLDNLHNTCVQYKKKGCHFAKWRCVYSISEKCPSQLAMTTNANVLARCTISIFVQFVFFLRGNDDDLGKICAFIFRNELFLLYFSSYSFVSYLIR